ncbi:MAG TPA: Nif3-like dinuclear metal center hexameric protein [Nocardioidaceae bacterium]|jgi:dinuclear metal center YbgI/SA1388 family protein|nr:Nif3-like dinuclear metal center hexameric protein [Nocardioidaceae bacterium]
MVRLSRVTGLLDEWYDPSTAEDWDAVGLTCGDPDQEVRRVLFAVDPAPVVVEEAVEWRADLLVTHHPLLLRPVHAVAATRPKGRTVHALIGAGCALFTAHTNADLPAGGVNESLALALGMQHPEVITATAAPGLDKLVVFVPHEHADRVRAAIVEAGAGAIGDYDSCTFTSSGEGRFRPLDGANPAIGRVGEVEVVQEVRVESVVPRSRRAAVVSALRAAHPYEEPAFDLVELADPPGTRGHGRIGALPQPMPLREFAAQVSRALPETAHGVRVSGDPDRQVRTVAVASGAGDYLLDTVLGSGADVFVTSDLRHHPASEFREHGRAALVDVAHWAAEWTWLPVVEARVRDAFGDGEDTVETRVSTTVTDPWSFRVD